MNTHATIYVPPNARIYDFNTVITGPADAAMYIQVAICGSAKF